MFAYNDKSRNIVGKEDIVKEENEKILKEENIKRNVKMISKGYSKEELGKSYCSIPTIHE